MAEKLERKVMEIYGENAATRDIIAYGSDIAGNIVETKDPDVIQTEAYKTGVRSAVVGNNSTTLQNRQALDFLFSRQLKYLYQHGVAEWGADETYFVNSLAVGSNGTLYVSLTDNNKGNDPVTDTTNWLSFPTPAQLAQKVAKAGDTMSGQLVMEIGSNGIRFNGATADNYYYVKVTPSGQLAIFNKNSKGLLLQAEEEHAPFYWDGTNVYRLLTTADKGMIVGWGMPDYSAGVSVANSTILSGFTAPSDGVLIFDGGISNATINGIAIPAGYYYTPDNATYGQPVSMLLSKGDILKAANIYSTTDHSIFYPLKGVN